MKRTVLTLAALLGVLIATGAAGQRVASGETTETRLFLPLIKKPAPTLIFSQPMLDNALSLFTIQADGVGKTRLTSTTLDDWEAAWSSDGSRVAFSRWSSQRSADGNFDTRHHVFIINADGTGQRQLVRLVSSRSPAWSPDGSLLAFIGYREVDYAGEPADPHLYVVRADGTGLRVLAPHALCDAALQWSPDGRKIVCGSSQSMTLLVVSGGGSEQQRLGSGHNEPLPGRFPWSPDSSRIVYATRNMGGANALLVQGVDGSPPVVLLSGSDYYADPGWSPDGRTIIFTTLAVGESSYRMAIESINPDGSGRTPLVELDNTRIEDPLWSPDGRRICFSGLDMKASPLWGVYVAGVDGSAPLRLTDGLMPSWRPRSQ